MTMHNGLVDQARKFNKRVASADTSAYKVVERGQLVVGFPIDEGVLAIQRLYPAAIVSPAYDVWQPHPTRIDGRFLELFLRSPTALTYYRARLRGSTARRRSLPTDMFRRMPVLLPPLDEQRRIAAILDGADELRAKRRAAIAHLDSLTEAIFLDMFGDPVTNPMGWPTAKLSTFGTLDRGVSKHRPRNDPALLGGPYPLIQTGDIARAGRTITSYSATYSEAGLQQSRLWQVGTLCITIAANIAETAILGFDACFPDSVVGFQAEPHDVEFVRSLLSLLRQRLEDVAPQSAQKNINLAVLREIRIALPSVAERKKYLSLASSASRELTRLQNHLAHLDELFASLQARAFAGEL